MAGGTGQRLTNLRREPVGSCHRPPTQLVGYGLSAAWDSAWDAVGRRGTPEKALTCVGPWDAWDSVPRVGV